MWILVVVVSSVPRWEFARTLQKNEKKNYGGDKEPGAGKKNQKDEKNDYRWVGIVKFL